MSNNPFKTGGIFGGGGGGSGGDPNDYIVGPFQDIPELQAYDTSSTNDAVIANVESNGIFRFDSSSTATADDISIVEPTVGGGRWIKETTSSIGRIFTVSGDGTADFTTVEAAVNALNDGDGIIRVIGDTTETGTAIIIEPVTPRSLRIEVEPQATVDCGDNSLLDITTSTGVLNLTLSGKFDYAFTSGKDLLDWTGTNLGGFLFIENAIFRNTSTVASTWIINNLDVVVFWESSAIILPNQDKCGLSVGNINASGLFLYGGGTSCSDALVVQDPRGLIRGLKVYGYFSLSFAPITTACALANVAFENTNSYFVNFFESVTNVTTDSSVTTVLGSNGSYSNFNGDISVAFSNSTNSTFSNSNISVLLPSINANSKCSFSNVTVSTSIDLTGGKDIFTNIRCDAGIEISNDNITLNSPSVLDSGQTITINSTAENTIINDARVDTPIIDNGVNSNISGEYINVSTFKYFKETGNNNYLINEDFSVWQRGVIINSAGGSNNDGMYACDRWAILSDGNNIINVTRESANVPSDATYAAKMSVVTNNKKFGFIQILDPENAEALIGGGNGQVALQFKIYTNGTSVNFRAAVLGWSGSPSSITRDAVSAWNGTGADPTLIANWNYRSTPFDINVTSSITTGTIKIDRVAMNASDTTIAVFIWMNDVTQSLAGNDYFLSSAKLDSGPYCSIFQKPDFYDNITRCQAFFQKSYRLDLKPGSMATAGQVPVLVSGVTEVASIITAIQRTSFVNYVVTMRRTPGQTVYSPATGAFNNIRDNTAGADIASTGFTSFNQTSASGINGTIPITSSDITFHYTLDSEI